MHFCIFCLLFSCTLVSVRPPEGYRYFGHLFPLLLSLLPFSLLNYWLISGCFSPPCKESPVQPDSSLLAPLLPPSLPPILCHHLELFSSLLWGIQRKEARRQTRSEMGCYVEGWKEHLRSGNRENKMWAFFRLKKKSWHPVMTGILAEPTMWLGNRQDGVSVVAFGAHNCRDRTCVNDCRSSRRRGVALRNTKQLTTIIRSDASGPFCVGALRLGFKNLGLCKRFLITCLCHPGCDLDQTNWKASSASSSSSS